MLKLNPDFQPPTEVFYVLLSCDETNSIAKSTLKFQYNQAAKTTNLVAPARDFSFCIFNRFRLFHLQHLQNANQNYIFFSFHSDKQS